MPKKPRIVFDCKWGVYRKDGDNSLCYTTGRGQALLISIALNRFINSEEGQAWIKKNK